ncbi:MAG: gyrase inhibitor YacG [Caulobacteraceae bacterium]|nr:gyrase inhibitor YacG [Caulobacteraceae bacterium]
MAAKCPICSKPAGPAYRPFCSRRCADVDLQRWLVGRYAIPAEREEDEDETPRPSQGGDEPD